LNSTASDGPDTLLFRSYTFMTCPSEMSLIQEQAPSVESSIHLVPVERRSRMRYPLVLPVRYHTVGRNTLSGEGLALNLSSGGILVACRHELSVGAQLEVSMEWPSLLGGTIPLQLVTLGEVVRCEASSFAVSFHRHQFRTMGNQTARHCRFRRRPSRAIQRER
jgi:hypothetical protein